MRSQRRRVSRRPAARTISARAAWIRRSTRSPTCRPSPCARCAACACTPGAASARATTSSRSNASSTRSPAPRGKDPLALAARADQGPSAGASRPQGRGRDVRLQAQAARPRHGDRVLRLPRHALGGRGGGFDRQEHRQDQGPQLLGRGRSGPRDPAGQRPRTARERCRLRAHRGAARGADGEGRRHPAVQLPRLSRCCA